MTAEDGAMRPLVLPDGTAEVAAALAAAVEAAVAEVPFGAEPQDFLVVLEAEADAPMLPRTLP
jgi:hypothetical protein